MKTKIVDSLFWLIPISLIINLFLRWNINSYLSPDSFDYFKIADHLPSITTSVWPFFYPLLLKIVNFVVDNYLVSYKVLSVSSLLFSLLFVRINHFYWKEIWTLLSFFSFLRIFPFGLSEVVLIPFLILIFYINHHFQNNKQSENKFILFNSIFLFITVSIKYSSIFFLIAFILFTVLLKFRKNILFKAYLKSSLLTLILCGLYLTVNYIETGFLIGERQPPGGSYHNIRLSISQIVFTLNPFFHTKVYNYLGLFSFGWSIAYLFGFIFSLIWLFLITGKGISFMKNNLIILLLINSLCFLAGTIYSYFVIKIDILDFRLLLGFYTFLFFAVIISLPRKMDVILLLTALFSISTNIIQLFV
ncbi:MAG: hypothetical protein LBE36_12575 [Flavobacteriaceae bacterium]|jgi:hypothetical protein|nr:hypothetical protein [Flavobacteriaceae bacterium]